MRSLDCSALRRRTTSSAHIVSSRANIIRISASKPTGKTVLRNWARPIRRSRIPRNARPTTGWVSATQ